MTSAKNFSICPKCKNMTVYHENYCSDCGDKMEDVKKVNDLIIEK